MKLKKTGLMLLCSVLLIVMVLSGCGNNEDPKASNTATEAPGDTVKPEDTATPEPVSIVNDPGVLPITKEKTKISILVQGRPNIDFATSSATKWVEEQTNLEIEWQVAPEGPEAQTKLNVVLASGDYPDVIMNFNVNNSQQLNYGKQGIFIPLNDLIEKYGVNMKANVFDVFPNVRDDITGPDGNIYSLPSINDCYQCSMGQKFWIYKPWLDALKLEVPTTTDELYTVLKAFKTMDPNGNKKADEIPMSGSIQGDNTGIDSFIMNAFVLNKITNLSTGFSITEGQRMYVDNGKVVPAFTQPGWKEGLKYLNKLYSEKLIDPQAFTQNKKQLKDLGENPDTVLLGATSSLGPNQFVQANGPSGRWVEYVAIPPLKGPDGFQVTPFNGDITKTGEFIITSAAEHPEVAMRLADFLYDNDVQWKLQKGEEGVNWRWAEKGEVGGLGEPALFAQLAPIVEEKSNNNWYQRGLSATPDAQRYTQTVDPSKLAPVYVWLYNATKDSYEPHKQKAETNIPILHIDEDNSKLVVDYSNTIGTYVNEMFARFVTGDQDIDKNWDTYIEQLGKMNLDKLMEIYQAAYDAKVKK